METFTVKQNKRNGQKYIMLPKSSIFNEGDRVDVIFHIDLDATNE